MKAKLLVATLFIFSTALLFAQNVKLTGNWKAKTVSARGTAEQTITFKQTGDKFTGKMVNSQGVEEDIEDGKITGDQIEFKIVRQQPNGNMAPVVYKGKVSGDEITGTFTGASGATVNWTAHREGDGSSSM